MPSDIRQAYLDFFKSKGHTIVPSDSLVPSSDPTLLFTSAGMVQFKAHFLQQIPLTFTRAASSQRCLRTTDIDNIGLTARHLTFFEMLGNFSFGDYFKEDAIAWAWEFFTKTLSLDQKRLWISVFRDDEEAAHLWKKHVPESRIVRMGEESNFWTMGPTGPCGPCSEIYWDRGDTPSASGPDDTDRWMEIWNLVFTQFDRQADGTLMPLPKKNIDTGMGLERLTSVVENVIGNFDTTLIRPLVKFAEDTFAYKYGSDPKKDISVRIVADHLRAVTFLIHDGILPSNEGRGYVLRRLLRRATRQGTLFGRKDPFLNQGVSLVAEMMKSTAPDLPNRVNDIALRIREEEERFLETIDSGSDRLKELIQTASSSKSKKVLGTDVFRLYDTYGFPPELTREMLAERGLSFDEYEFQKAKLDAQTMAREGWKGSGAQDVTIYNSVVKENGRSTFRGYDTMSMKTSVIRLLKAGQFVAHLNAGETGEVIAAETPFYPEGGGQVGDKGWLRNAQGDIVADILDTQKPVLDLIVHIVKTRSRINVSDNLEFLVDKNLREPTQRHHTATHLLHAALRNTIGKTVTQAGSYVEPERLRFDYTHNKPLTQDQIVAIEDIVNNAILHNLKVTPKVFSADEAKKMGAMALFGEKYGDNVRCLLVSAGDFDTTHEAFSLELCGGTHVSATGDIGAFKILSDLTLGRRRSPHRSGRGTSHSFVFAQTSRKAVFDFGSSEGVRPEDVDQRVAKLIEKQKHMEQEIRDLKLKMAQGAGSSAGAASEVQNVNGVPLAIKVVDGLDSKELRTLADRLKEQLKSAVIFAASVVNDEGREKISFVFAVTPDLKPKGFDAGKLAKAAAAELNGSGGGRPDFAQGGGEGKGRLDALIKKLPSLLAI